MTDSSSDWGARNHWRIARWGAALVLVLTPLIMMQFNDGWHWTISSFLAAGTIIGGILFTLGWLSLR